eukprot:gene26794-35121_t
MSRVADFLGTVHHSYTYTIQEGLDAIREVIYHLETFDTTTVRASTPMFLMAPNPEELQAELRDKIANLYLFDCLRANKTRTYLTIFSGVRRSSSVTAWDTDHYPQNAAVKTVPGGPSIACSTARAIEWDASFKNRADCSGRAVAGVHNEAYDDKFKIAPATEAEKKNPISAQAILRAE